MDEEVELRHAWLWDCPECGRECLYRGVAINDEERDALLKENGLPPHTILLPYRVACTFCDKIFNCIDPNAGREFPNEE